MKVLYKYPQAAFPYQQLLDGNARRSRDEPEYELLDTGVFDDDRYFDVVIEYAKADADDILMQITVHNRGRQQAPSFTSFRRCGFATPGRGATGVSEPPAASASEVARRPARRSSATWDRTG